MDTVFDKSPAILVDYATWRTHTATKAFIDTAHNVVLLVGAGENYEWREGDPDWQAVIKNNGKMDDLTFKTAALCLVQDSGTLVPAVAIDIEPSVRIMYVDANVPVVMSGGLSLTFKRGEYYDVA